MSLQDDTAAVRISFTWWGITKSLSTDQKALAAQAFNADPEQTTASKKLIDSKNVHYREVARLKSEISETWKSMTLPYVEPGIRLIKRSQIDYFDRVMQSFRDGLTTAVGELQTNFEQLKAEAQTKLGTLFNTADYPSEIGSQFSVAWDYPNLNPPDYLAQLNPRLYEAERQRIQERFQEAARIAEETFAAEMQKMVGHLVDRLTPAADGTKKVFRDSAIENLTEFFARFRNLSSSMSGNRNKALDQLVTQAEGLMCGVNPETLRDDDARRTTLASGFEQIATQLDGMVTSERRRNWRRTQTQTQTPAQATQTEPPAEPAEETQTSEAA